jgi:lytic murein transglycosylase
MRLALVLGLMISALMAMSGQRARAQDDEQNQHFQSFVKNLWPDAHRLGVSRANFDAAFLNLGPDPAILAKSQNQAEFVKPLGDYLTQAVSAERIDRGQHLNAQWGDVLSHIEAAYGVDRFIVLAIWGIESHFGSYAGSTPVVQALATLAAGGYRTPYFRNELLEALLILEQKHIAVADFKGSWAGAMGQTQFMPSSFLKYAVDFDGDGRKDIWGNVPDALASTANYLHLHGWQRDLIWGYEVQLPSGFALSSESANVVHSFAQWREQGLARADGRPLPDQGEASLVEPAGSEGPAFLLTTNFKVIRSYNHALAYGLAVALLSDRIAGAEPLRGRWPMAAQ